MAKITKNPFKIQIITPVVTSHISDNEYDISTMAECIIILFEKKRDIFYAKNYIKNLQTILTYIESAFSRSIQFIVIFLQP